MKRQCYIGVMSGTSMDSVDVVICPVGSDGIEMAASLAYPFDPLLKTEILEVIGGMTTLQQVGSLDQRLGHLFADAVSELIARYGLNVAQIEAVGLHGQTLWHQPEGAAPFSMQLGDPNIVAARTGVRVVADFRRMDMAMGGQGAPFAPAFHQFVFGSSDVKSAIVNIGGIANVTLLGEALTGYDTGPGNMLIDGWIRVARGDAYDEKGAWASEGRVHEALLESLLDDPYFKKLFPKSTGREYFNTAWLEMKMRGAGSVDPQDVQATLTELTARTIADAVSTTLIERLLVCGGGAKNDYLMQRLSGLLPEIEVALTDTYGVSSDYMEAMAFAWLACKRLKNETVELKSVTGASRNGLLGGIYG